MERLTEKIQIGPFASLKDKAEAVPGAFGTYDCLYAHMVAVTRLKQYEDALPLERAQELAQAEKDGRLVVLPCKVGDTVFAAETNPVIPLVVAHVGVILDGKDGEDWESLDNFGKTVFLPAKKPRRR